MTGLVWFYVIVVVLALIWAAWNFIFKPSYTYQYGRFYDWSEQAYYAIRLDNGICSWSVETFDNQADLFKQVDKLKARGEKLERVWEEPFSKKV